MGKKLFSFAFLALWCFCPIKATAAKTTKNYSFCTGQVYDREDKLWLVTHCEFGTQIQFMSQWNSQPIIANGYGAKLETGLTRAQVKSGWWMSTTCPAIFRPFKPDVPFVPENRDRINAGDYKCVGE